MIEEEYDGYDEDVEYYAVRPNKTQIKKDIAALFALGEEMSNLSPDQLNTLMLPEKILQAVREVSGMPHKGARKRLLKYIAGQLHLIDVAPIIEKLERIKNKSAHAVREHHLAEQWRDRLIAEGNEALTELLDEHPEADSQQLRQLIRNAQKEIATAKPPKSARLLYRYVKELLQNEGLTQAADDSEADEEEAFWEDQDDL
ncbi:ribosome biogenesis factor YjgA [Methylomicrobium lacus]|uniref:ribosome biogenesis factor YjgA n=1 Tax=Methylomicrobium lacus TaxID=136992 RepID=UPI0035A8EAB9